MLLHGACLPLSAQGLGKKGRIFAIPYAVHSRYPIRLWVFLTIDYRDTFHRRSYRVNEAIASIKTEVSEGRLSRATTNAADLDVRALLVTEADTLCIGKTKFSLNGAAYALDSGSVRVLKKCFPLIRRSKYFPVSFLLRRTH
ncbi:hypothetical protein [Hymenobacter sp. B81]|uniref:hypothetical protein n=1 Tax=Hymenobacter sp. B81 TaxID=3344878 RepID=UPI0037DD7D02